MTIGSSKSLVLRHFDYGGTFNLEHFILLAPTKDEQSSREVDMLLKSDISLGFLVRYSIFLTPWQVEMSGYDNIMHSKIFLVAFSLLK